MIQYKTNQSIYWGMVGLQRCTMRKRKNNTCLKDSSHSSRSHIEFLGKMNDWIIDGFLVVEPYPSEKWWSKSQLGLWHYWMESHKSPWFQTTNHLDGTCLFIAFIDSNAVYYVRCLCELPRGPVFNPYVRSLNMANGYPASLFALFADSINIAQTVYIYI